MVDDPFQTQRYVLPRVEAELEAAGFYDAQEIGRGGFGVVYRCVQSSLARTVAVKVLTSPLDAESQARFIREQQAMGQLTGHPNIVNVLQVGATDSGSPYLVMPYHPQGSLEVQLRQQGPLALEEWLRLGVKIAGAVQGAHELGILHRDIKPANILLTDYGEPALTDFGIARVSGGFETAAGTVTGSPAFTAPEVLSGHHPSPASDVYGLGATLFSAITGHAAFERHSGEQVVAQFLRITTQPVPNLREQGMPDDIAAAIERAMAADPDDRPSAAQLGENLRQIQLNHGFPVDEMAMRRSAVPTRQDVVSVRSRPADPVSYGQHMIVSAGAHRGSKGNLPMELTSFVGRRTELAEARNLLTSSRLVTLTGIGGVGKTRLARRLATNAQAGYDDGAWLVELGELRDESLLVHVVAAALGLQHHSARPFLEILVDYLAERQLLLVLDNCEQVVNTAATLAETLLRACPKVRILATSREPLDIGGEAVLRVPPLTIPEPYRASSLQGLPSYEAVTLFADRATAAVPGFTLTEANHTAVAEICCRLDGLPLPIELAAARLRAMSPEQLVQRLTDRFALLTRGTRNAPSRQRTLRLSIDWSYDLCTTREQQLWSRLSVFAGSVQLDAAEWVCGVELSWEELLDTFSSLVDKSILVREEAGAVVRFRLLETLREYGREKLQEAGEYVDLRRRHRDWYEQLVLEAEAGWISAQQLEWISRLETEQPNLREAMDFSVSDTPESGLRIAAGLHHFWNARGMFSEGRRWLDRLLALSVQRPTIDRVKALYVDSVLAELQGDIGAGAALVDEARVLASQSSDPLVRALVDHAEGHLAIFSGEDIPRACLRFESALQVFDALEDYPMQVGALHVLGLAYELQGKTERAIEFYNQALAITEARGESMYRSRALWARGFAAWRQGDFSNAVRFLERALELAREVDNPSTVATILEVMAWSACSERNAHRATVLMGAAAELGRSMGSVAVVFPNLIVYHDECEQESRRVLGVQAFEAARREGSKLGFDAAIGYALSGEIRRNQVASATLEKLTKRERQVAELVTEGLTNREIAARLVISPRTAQGHVEHILTKLGFTSRAQIAAWVAERGT